ncbi:hypothetical protein DNI29_07895 [Hymenobacter sediminis]|uniref:hypothetical protein n=1 Tax=Hymenobacter sediminis TaxID=2218621 RepID=UPI000F4F5DFF|nr:hypothetical protein [Hymenobacter sediminis]RPD48527.1 hypothetical protein DNI29_07895 [Hymenobacter sediminis]
MRQLTVFAWSIMSGEEEPIGFDLSNPTHIFFETTKSGVQQFPQHLAIYRTPNEDWEARALWLGQLLSKQFKTNVMVPFTHPEKPHYPYYDIIFQDGESYLADDGRTECGEPDSKPVVLLGAYVLPHLLFDAAGKLIKV